MINWQSVILNSFWIVGLAILLAAFSYSHWQAGEEGQPLREVLEKRPFQQWFWVSCILIGIGLIGTSDPLWEKGIWSLFTAYSIINTIRALPNKRLIPSQEQKEVGDL